MGIMLLEVIDDVYFHPRHRNLLSFPIVLFCLLFSAFPEQNHTIFVAFSVVKD